MAGNIAPLRRPLKRKVESNDPDHPIVIEVHPDGTIRVGYRWRTMEETSIDEVYAIALRNRGERRVEEARKRRLKHG